MKTKNYYVAISFDIELLQPIKKIYDKYYNVLVAGLKDTPYNVTIESLDKFINNPYYYEHEVMNYARITINDIINEDEREIFKLYFRRGAIRYDKRRKNFS